MDAVIDFIHNQGWEWTRRGDEAICNCPVCGDKEKKFAINLVSGAYNCLRLKNCGIRGSFWDLQKKMGVSRPIKIDDRNPIYSITPKKKYLRPKVEIQSPTSPVIEYLHKRGFTDATIKFFKLGAKGNDVVMIPYYKGGELTGIKYRSIVDKKKMWTENDSEPLLYNRDNITSETLRIVEGEWDCVALYEYAICAVSVPMGARNFQWVDQEWEYLESFKQIEICFDGDSVGRQAALDLAVRLGEWRCKLVTLPLKDANACLMADISIADMWLCFENAEEIKPETVVRADHFRGEIEDLFERGAELFGIKTPWQKLNDILKGWRPGEITVWSGRNGAGKSTILNQVFIDLIKKRFKVGIFSGEMRPARFLRWAIIQFCENDEPTRKDIDDAIDWMGDKVYILNIQKEVNPKKLASDFEYAARRYGVSHFFIDSLMKVSFDERNEFQQQKDFVSSLGDFADKFGAHIHLVAHPRKTQTDDDAPGKVDVKGSSHITDLCDNLLILHRIPEEAKERAKRKGTGTLADMKMVVQKNREFGIEGIIKFMFNIKSKCFSDEDMVERAEVFDGKSAATGDD